MLSLFQPDADLLGNEYHFAHFRIYLTHKDTHCDCKHLSDGALTAAAK